MHLSVLIDISYFLKNKINHIVEWFYWIEVLSSFQVTIDQIPDYSKKTNDSIYAKNIPP